MKLAFHDRLWTERYRLQCHFTSAKSSLKSPQTGAIGAGASKVKDLHSFLFEDIGNLRHQKGRGAKLHPLGQSASRLIICALAGSEHQNGRQHPFPNDCLKNLPRPAGEQCQWSRTVLGEIYFLAPIDASFRRSIHEFQVFSTCGWLASPTNRSSSLTRVTN